ncbi:hypothetical protein GX48_08359 [Paracoccidioides brasiliensis]|nr:hypothetical protein GX48_08359 [Paracoccidioides brasiliensis]
MRFTAGVSITSDEEEFYDLTMDDSMGHEDVSAGAPAWLQELLHQQASRDEAFRIELEDLRTQLAVATTTTPAASTPPTNTVLRPSCTPSHDPDTKRPNVKLTPLETFDGTDLVRYPTCRLSGAAATQFHPWMNANSAAPLDPETFFTQLDILFSDPALTSEAPNWLQSAHENKPLVKAIQSCASRFISTSPRTITASTDSMDWQPSAMYLASQATVIAAAKLFRVSGISGADAAERRVHQLCKTWTHCLRLH